MKTPYGNRRVHVHAHDLRYVGTGYVVLQYEDRRLHGKYSGLNLIRAKHLNIPLYVDDKISFVD